MNTSPFFTNQADLPPTTHRPEYTAPNPYAKRQFDAGSASSNSSTANSSTAGSRAAKLEYDEALVQKYNRSGPRYTSYPTALEFQPIAAGAELEILTSRDPNAPLSLYFHIPFCRHLCYYCACNKIITKKNSDAGDYLDYLKAEIKQKRALLASPNGEQGKKPFVKQLHLGGGTPTFFSDDELIELWQFLQTQFDFAPSSPQSKEQDGQSSQDGQDTSVYGDYSIEIDPREMRDTTLAVLRNLGFNRVSFGVQDLDDKVQIAVNRVQSEALIQSVMDEARRLGFHSINIDLIYGLPHQTPVTFARTVERIIKMSPDRLSIFNYAHLPARFKAQRQINEDDLPSGADKLAMFSQTISALNEAGYHYIGIDHFAKPQDELAVAQREGKLHRNFQGYTILGDCDLLGFGVSAISQINSTLYCDKKHHDKKSTGSVDSDSQSPKVTGATHILQNNTDIDDYRQSIDAGKLPAVKHIKTTIQDRLRGYVIANLLCHDYIDFKDVNQKFGIDTITYFIDEIQRLGEMQQDRLIDMDAAGIRILPKGRLLARNVAMVFDSYLANKEKGRFSKVI